MSPRPHPSIQSYYRKEAAPLPPARRLLPGSSETREEAAGPPATVPWQPDKEYQEVAIAQLQNGSGPAVRVTGRIVNYSTAREIAARRPFMSGSSHFLVLKDDTGAVAVRLMAAGAESFPIRLGKLVTVWTAFVAEYATSSPVYMPFVSLMIPVHLGQYSSSCIRFHDDEVHTAELCRFPFPHLGGLPSSPPSTPDCMSLGQYLCSNSEDMPDAKILVCVRGIGPRKNIRLSRQEGYVNLVDVTVFDETDSCVLKLWGDKTACASAWRPNQTILLITNPVRKVRDNRFRDISIGFTTLVDVDPIFPDADWLRQMAGSTVKKDSAYTPFPHDKWDPRDAEKTLFTLAELDEFAREEAHFTGKLNLVILGVNLTDLLRQGMLCCFECCGTHMYSNKATAFCKHCASSRDLVLNPRVVGTVSDETGCIASSKMLWSDAAWAQLFFQEPAASRDGFDTAAENHGGGDISDMIETSNQAWEMLTTMDKDALRALEEQLLYSRVTLTFGWSLSVARLCILGVEW